VFLLVPAYLGCPGPKAIEWLCVCVCVCLQLLTSAAVHRWGIDIQEGIFDMLQLLIDLIATRLHYEPVPVDLLHVLAMVYSRFKKILNWD